MSLNLIKDVDPGNSENITVIIEIPRGSKNKYEIDKDYGMIKLDRVLYTAQDYPVDYGFVPQTLWDDGDPLDVCVITTHPLTTGIIVNVRPIGVINMIDGGDSDIKVLAVPVEDPRFSHLKDISDLNQHIIKEIEHFFKTYKDLNKKEVVIEGIAGVEEAKKAFEKSRKLYKESLKN